MNVSRDDKLERIIAEFLEAEHLGEVTDRQLVLRNHPDLADDLRLFFVNHDRMNVLAAPGRPDAPAAETSTVHPGPNAATARVQADDAATRKTKNRRFGEYELLEKIAQGGMGVVYRARHAPLNRIVALKMIRAGEFASDEEVRRFHSEAKAAAQLDHANIVPVFETGEQSGQQFFSMGFVEGRSLQQAISGGPLTDEHAAELVRIIAEAVAFAHAKGIVHRDLKPSNVLIDKNGQPKVADFGLAKQTAADSSLTATGQVIGTPSYMPPEQAAGLTERVGPLSDVYSLGAILYCLVTGRPPFQAAHVVETLRRVLTEEPVAPGQINPGISRDLETICLKCLEKEPSRRYASAAELAAELSHFLEGRPIAARPLKRAERTWRWMRRNPTLTALYAVLVTGFAVSSVLAVKWREEAGAANRANDKVTQQSQDLRQRGEKLKQTVGNLNRTLTQRDEALKKRDEALKRRNTALRDLKRRTARNDLNLGLAELEKGRIDRGLLYLARALETVPGVDTAEMSENDKNLTFTIRSNIELWRSKLHVLKWQVGLRGRITGFSPNSRKLLRTMHFYIANGKPVGPAAEILDTETGKRLSQKIAHSSGVLAIGLTNEGKSVVIVEPGTMGIKGKSFAQRERPGRIQLWDAATGKRIGRPILCGTPLKQALIGPTGRVMLTVPRDLMNYSVPAGQPVRFPKFAARIWNLQQKAIGPITLTTEDGSRIVTAAITPDARLVVARCAIPEIRKGDTMDHVGAGRTSIRAWELSSGKAVNIKVSRENKWGIDVVEGMQFTLPGTLLLPRGRVHESKDLSAFDIKRMSPPFSTRYSPTIGAIHPRRRLITNVNRLESSKTQIWNARSKERLGQLIDGTITFDPVKDTFYSSASGLQCWYVAGFVPDQFMQISTHRRTPTAAQTRLWIEVATGLELNGGDFRNTTVAAWNKKREQLRGPAKLPEVAVPSPFSAGVGPGARHARTHW